MKEKHTRHCRMRMKYGDGYCECGGAGPAEPAKRCTCVDSERDCPKHNCEEIRKEYRRLKVKLEEAEKKIKELKVKRTNKKTLFIQTSFPTVVGVPPDEGEADLENITTKTSVGWPENWHKLSIRWRAILLAKLLHKIVGAFAANGSPRKNEEMFKEFRLLTGWGYHPEDLANKAWWDGYRVGREMKVEDKKKAAAYVKKRIEKVIAEEE